MRELFPRVKTLESRKCQRTFELSINLDQGLFKVCFSEKWLILYVVWGWPGIDGLPPASASQVLGS